MENGVICGDTLLLPVGQRRENIFSSIHCLLKMNRLFVLFVFLLIGLAVYLVVELPREADLLDLVPNNSQAVLDWDKPADTISFFRDGSLGKGLRDFDRTGIYSAIGFSPGRVELIEKGLALSAEIISNEFVEIIFNNRVVIALLPVSDGGSEIASGLSKNFVLLTRVSQTLLDAVNDLEDRRVLKPLIHNGVTVNRVLMPGGGIIYFAKDREKDIFIFALNSNPVKKSIDLSFLRVVGINDGITGNPAYVSFQDKSTGEESLLFFINNDGLTRISRHHLFSGLGDNSSIARFLSGGFEDGGFFYQTRGTAHKFTSILNFNPVVVDSLLPDKLRRPPVENRLIARMPSDTQVYLWSNWLDMGGWWWDEGDRIKDGTGKWGEWLVSFVQENSGVEISEFLNSFGEQAEFSVKEIRPSVFLPVPVIQLSVELADSEKIENFLDSALEPFLTSQVKINSFPVASVSLAGGIMEPAYGIFDNFFIFADSKEQIKEMLATGDKLVDNDEFIALGMDLSRDKNLIFFTRSEHLINGVKDIMLWLRESGNCKGEMIDHVAMPALDIFSLFTAGSLWLSMGKKDMVAQVSFLIKGEKKKRGHPDH